MPSSTRLPMSYRKVITAALWIAGGIYEFFREAIKAWFFDKVVHYMNPHEELALVLFVSYGVPLLLILSGLLVLVDERRVKATPKQAATTVYPDLSRGTPWWTRKWLTRKARNERLSVLEFFKLA